MPRRKLRLGTWLTPQATARLAALARHHGTITAALEAAIYQAYLTVTVADPPHSHPPNPTAAIQ